MGLSLVGVAARLTPTFFSTLYRHLAPWTRNAELQRSQANRELKYALSWRLVAGFLELATHHTVEQLQHFCDTVSPTPIVPPSIWHTKVAVPLSTLSDAAGIVIDALGGPERCHELVGGTRWWQVRQGEVEGEWYGAKKALAADGSADGLKTILYITGGGYYFGGLATHRFMIWKHARNAGMRAFAVNYRKAPQYSFPCALQDCIAAYLFLVEPPPGSSHEKISPSDIVLMGDSAGAGLVLSVLQTLRSTNGVLGLPAGAALVSPWCDLTHSFPSVNLNQDYDILPPYSFIHRPSLCWPPPIPNGENPIPPPGPSEPLTSTHQLADPLDAGPSTPLVLQMTDEVLEIRSTQVQLYAPNHLLAHPLVSPAGGDLKGLCPLLIICSDKESLRDEGIFIAHQAAGRDVRKRDAIEEKYPEAFSAAREQVWKAGTVHLQVYDDASHILPVFSYTKIAEPTYQSIARFAKLVTAPRAETSVRLIPSRLEETAASDEEYYLKTPYVDNMIRERVGIRGALRELEPMDQLGAFSLPASEMHVVKANMVQRFMTGQHLWARKYPSTRYLERREALRKKWIAENPQEIDLLAGECPPPAALAGRRDTKQAHELAHSLHSYNGSFPFGTGTAQHCQEAPTSSQMDSGYVSQEGPSSTP